MRSLTRAATITLCAASALALTACGSSTTPDSKDSGPKAAASEKSKAAEPAPFADLTGSQVANKAIKATKDAKSMRLVVDVKSTDGPIKADFFTGAGGNCTGTMSVNGEGSADLIKVGDKTYTKFDEALLRSQSKGESKEDTETAVKLLAGKWIESTPDDPDTKDMLGFCDLDAMLKEFPTGVSGTRKAGGTTVDGKPALNLTEKEGAETYTVAVATEGTPYLLMIGSTGGKEPMTMKLSDFDKPVVAKKPAAKDIVDLDNPTG